MTNKQSILFLDIDGVLNNENSRSLPLIPIKEYDFYGKNGVGLNQFDPVCVDALNKITQATGASIVISSDWRLYFYDEEFPILKRFLQDRGIDGDIIGHTDCHTYDDRVKEIEMWLEANKVESFVILEDWCEMRHLEKFTVRTNSDEGLAKRHIKEAVRILHA